VVRADRGIRRAPSGGYRIGATGLDEVAASHRIRAPDALHLVVHAMLVGVG
jgi:hypothetical protein